MERDVLLCNNVKSGHQEINEVNKKKKKLKPKCARSSCKNRGTHRCNRCKSVYYCEQDCLTEDWGHHKAFCDYVYEDNKVPDDSSKDPEGNERTGGTVEEVD